HENNFVLKIATNAAMFQSKPKLSARRDIRSFLTWFHRKSELPKRGDNLNLAKGSKLITTKNWLIKSTQSLL
ncbi:25498_t:CDS:1, partial [Racocetra persica]